MNLITFLIFGVPVIYLLLYILFLKLVKASLPLKLLYPVLGIHFFTLQLCIIESTIILTTNHDFRGSYTSQAYLIPLILTSHLVFPLFRKHLTLKPLRIYFLAASLLLPVFLFTGIIWLIFGAYLFGTPVLYHDAQVRVQKPYLNFLGPPTVVIIRKGILTEYQDMKIISHSMFRPEIIERNGDQVNIYMTDKHTYGDTIVVLYKIYEDNPSVYIVKPYRKK